MANSSVKLPVVDPFELTTTNSQLSATSGLEPEIEAALMSGIMAPLPTPVPAAPLVRPSVVPASDDAAAARLNVRAAAERPKLEAMDPELVARRLAQLRRPVARPEGLPPAPPPRDAQSPDPPPRDTKPADGRPRLAARMSPVATAQARWEAPAEAAPPPRVAIAAAPSAARPRPDPNRIPARPVRQARPAPAPLSPANDVAAADPEGVPDTLESALRGWSTGDGLVASAAARQRPAPRRGMFWTAALLLASGAAGGLIAVQWLAPRDQAAAATAPVPAVAVASIAPAPGASRAVAPAATAAAGQPAAKTVHVDVVAPPAATAPATVATLTPPAVAAAVPPWLAEDDPGSLAASAALPGASAAPSGPPAPSWAVEDDPTAFQAPSAVRPMLITADVDLRSGPDAKFTSLGVLKAGSVVPVSNCTQWCAVTVNGTAGWVFYSFLADPALATPTPAAPTTTTASK